MITKWTFKAESMYSMQLTFVHLVLSSNTLINTLYSHRHNSIPIHQQQSIVVPGIPKELISFWKPSVAVLAVYRNTVR